MAVQSPAYTKADLEEHNSIELASMYINIYDHKNNYHQYSILPFAAINLKYTSCHKPNIMFCMFNGTEHTLGVRRNDNTKRTWMQILNQCPIFVIWPSKCQTNEHQ